MKLIDILVQELHKLGGWPDGVNDIEMLEDGSIFFDGDLGPEDFKLPQCSDGWNRFKSSRDYTNRVTREKYEVALAASKPEWDGEGLPPVGCECEYMKQTVMGGNNWSKGTIKYISEYTVVIDDDTLEGEFISPTLACNFRPIRSEADKIRVSIISKIEKAYKDCPHSDAVPQAIYEAIAEHIRID